MKAPLPFLILCALVPLSLAQGARLEGVVRDGQGRPQGDVAVMLWYGEWLRPDYPFQARTRTDAKGRYSFTGPWRGGEGRLLAYHAGKSLAAYGEAPGRGKTLELSAGAVQADLVLKRTALLRVRFQPPEGLPAVEGEISLDGGQHWSPFAESEAVLAGLEEGAVGVKYYSEQYGGGAFFTSLEEAESKDTTVLLPKPDWIEGRLLDPQGRPMGGALYRAENAFRGGLCLSGPDGSIRLRRPKSGAVKVLFRDYRFRDAALTVRRETASPVEVTFQPGAGMIQGGIGNHRAAGLQGCQVSALPKSVKGPEDPRITAARRYPGGLARRALPSPDGSFALGGLEDEGYALRVDCPGTEAWEDTASPGARLAPFDLGPARAVDGKVTAEGRPVADFAVKLFRLRPESPEEALQNEPLESRGGRFHFASGFAGGNVVCVRAAGLPAACKDFAPGDTAAWELPRGAGLSLGIWSAPASAAPSALPGARIKVKRLGSRGAGWTGQSDAAGQYRLEGLAEGEYSVDVREAGHVPWRMTWEAEIGKTAELKALLEPGQALQGVIRQADGKAPAGLRVLARPEWAAGRPAPGLSDPFTLDQGNFHITGLPQGMVTLVVAAPWSKAAPFLPLYRRDRVAPGVSVDLRLPPARRLEISPAAGGRPLEGEAEIHVLLPPQEGPGEPLGHALAKAAFRKTWSASVFTGVKYVVVLEAAGYLRREDTVSVPPGDEPYEYRMDLQAWADAPPVPPRAEAALAVMGLTLDAQGKPLAGGKVVLRRRAARDSLQTAVSDGAGRFRFQVAPGIYLACPSGDGPCTRVVAAGADTLPIPVRFRGNVETVVAFTLPMPLPSRGGALLQAPGAQYRSVEMRDGDFLFPAHTFRALPAGRLKLSAFAYVPQPATLFWSGDSSAAGGRLGIACPLTAVEAAAHDEAGKPVAGVQLRFLPRDGGQAWGDGAAMPAWAAAAPGTDGAGTLRCLGVGPGKYWVYASHATYAGAPLAWEFAAARPSARRVAKSKAPPPSNLTVNLTLRRGSLLRVRVVRAANPAPGARVEVFDTLGNLALPSGGGKWDWRGNYEAGALAPGKYRVMAWAEGMSRQARNVTVAAGQDVDLEFTPVEAGWLEVVGDGLEDKVFYLKDKNQQVTYLFRSPETPPLGADGSPASALFSGIAPEKYQLWMEGGKQSLGEVDIKAGGLEVLEVGRLEKLRVVLPNRRG